MARTFGVKITVIDVDKDIVEGLGHDMHTAAERGRSVTQSHGKTLELVQSQRSDEGCEIHTVGLHGLLIEPRMSVELGEDLGPIEFPPQIGNEREWPPVRDGIRVEDTVVDDKAPLATRLGYEESRRGPRRVGFTDDILF